MQRNPVGNTVQMPAYVVIFDDYCEIQPQTNVELLSQYDNSDAVPCRTPLVCVPSGNRWMGNIFSKLITSRNSFQNRAIFVLIITTFNVPTFSNISDITDIAWI